MTTDDVQMLLIAAGFASTVGGAGLLTVRVASRRSVRAALLAVAVVSVLSVVAGVVGTSEAMFISAEDLSVLLPVSAVAAVVAIVVARVLGRQVIRDVETVQGAARRLTALERPTRRSPVRLAELAEIDDELAEAGRRLADARRREQSLETSRRELIAWVSHDLRTPLAGLRAMAEALEDGVASDPPRYLRQIRREVDRLARLVDDLFELSRIQAGVLTATVRHIELTDLVSDVLAGSLPMAEADGVHLDAVAQPAHVEADPTGLGRALTNLVVNAIRHTPTDGSVQIGCRCENHEAVLSVSDACGGLDPETIDRMFDAGWSGDPARTPGPRGGAGLGLAIARGIVEANHGRIQVVNTRQGCRFEVRLPLASAGRRGPEPLTA